MLLRYQEGLAVFRSGDYRFKLGTSSGSEISQQKSQDTLRPIDTLLKLADFFFVVVAAGCQ